jgi:hypothetical protein
MDDLRCEPQALRRVRGSRLMPGRVRGCHRNAGRGGGRYRITSSFAVSPTTGRVYPASKATGVPASMSVVDSPSLTELARLPDSSSPASGRSPLTRVLQEAANSLGESRRQL